MAPMDVVLAIQRCSSPANHSAFSSSSCYYSRADSYSESTRGSQCAVALCLELNLMKADEGNAVAKTASSVSHLFSSRGLLFQA